MAGLNVSPQIIEHKQNHISHTELYLNHYSVTILQVIKHYHGHLSAVYAIDLHPTIDVLLTCGRDGTARVWDQRTKACIHTLTGHNNTVADVRCQAAEPQVIIIFQRTIWAIVTVYTSGNYNIPKDHLGYCHSLHPGIL